MTSIGHKSSAGSTGSAIAGTSDSAARGESRRPRRNCTQPHGRPFISDCSSSRRSSPRRESGHRSLLRTSLLALVASALLLETGAHTVIPEPPVSTNWQPGLDSAKVSEPASVRRAPVVFESNVGQFASDVAFVARASSFSASFSASGVRMSGSGPGDGVIEMTFAGVRSEPTVSGEEILSSVTNYLLGNDPTAWRRGVPNFARIRYGQIYPGIDALFYATPDGALEYDFVLSPGADPSNIKIQFSSDHKLQLDSNGELVIAAGSGEIRHSAPIAYQRDAGMDTPVPSRFEIAASTVSYAIGPYDLSRELVIDPVLTYSSLVGGSGVDRAQSVAVDITGSAYVAGHTTSADFPVVTPIQGSNAGDTDIFVTKVNPGGTGVDFSTYIGGTSDDAAYALRLDSSGAPYIAGFTRSSDFPTVGAFQTSKAGAAGVADGFVAKLDPSGSTLSYSSYHGGSSEDIAIALAVDSSGSAYLTGFSYSTDFPMSSPMDSTFGGVYDAFATKVAASGASLVYSTYLGGASDDNGIGIDVDSSGNAYMTGYTFSTDFPTVSAIQPTRSPAGNDFFVSKLNSAGSALVYSTYLGGTGHDNGYAIDVDDSGNAYVAGMAQSPDFPTASPIQASNAGGVSDGVAFKINSSGTSLDYSTYFGGSADDEFHGIAVDSSGSAVITGWTTSTNFPVSNAIQKSNAGGSDATIVKLDVSGTSSTYSTYHGGTSSDRGQEVALDSGSAAYVVGETSSGASFPTKNPFQPEPGGSTDGFITKVPHLVAVKGSTVPGSLASVSAFDKSTGALIDYQCCNWSGSWSMALPPASCPGTGYKILLNARSGYQSRWYNLKPNWSTADCVSAPSSGNDMTLPASAGISGYVKDATTAADIDGAVVYAYRSSDGAFVGWSKSGGGGAGRYSLNLEGGVAYKLLANAASSNENRWHDSAWGYSDATPTTAPGAANFSLREAAIITGTATQSGLPLGGVLVSAYTSCGCTTPSNALSDGSGLYSVKVPSTSASGWTYRLRFIPPAGQTRWYMDSTGFGGAAELPAPSSGINQETPA